MLSLLLGIAVLSPAPLDAADSYIRHEMEVRRIPGLAVAVVKDGRVVKRSTYGLADIENGVRVGTDSVFELASLTKQFTSTAIMLLAEDGKLKIDDPISAYLPETPESWKAVTVRHLLTHTGGFATLREGFKDLPRTTSRTTEAMYANLKTRGLEFAPGSKFAYSDEGYFLLGMIVERASGKKYAEFLKQRIFDPLDMKTASVPDLRTILPHRVRGYTLYRGDLINIMRQVRTELPSHYGIFATIDDLVKWEDGLRRSALLPKKLWNEAWTSAQLTDGSKSGYGFGWNVWTRNGAVCLNHTGITGTEITRFPNNGVTVIILTNLGTWGDRDNAGSSPWGMTQRIAEFYAPKLAFKPIADADPTRTAHAEQVLASIVKGELPKGGCSQKLIEWAKSNWFFKDTYGFLGRLSKLVLVEDTGEEVTYRALFEKGDRYVAFEFAGGLVEAVFPVDE